MKIIVIFLIFIFSAQCFAFGGKAYNESYNPKRDPFADLKAASSDARADNKLILAVLGGEWCSWCHKLNAFIRKDRGLHAQIEKTFVIMKVNVSDENGNKRFLATLPTVKGYPFFVIFDKSGNVLGAQNTGGLEKGDSYSREKLIEFVQSWEGRRS